MKGWTVKTKAVKNGSKGVARRQVYLLNANHPNHTNTTALTTIHGNDRHYTNMVHSAEVYGAKQRARGKGGRPPATYAIEFTLNLPKGHVATDNEWRQILTHCMKQLAGKGSLELDPKELAATTVAVLHRQNQEGDPAKGTGDHLHVVVGKFTKSGKYLKNLQRKTATARMKQGFNEATLKYCGFDWTEYAKHLQEQKYPNKRNVPTWRVRAAREREELDQREAELKKREDLADEKLSHINNLMDEAEEILDTKLAINRLGRNLLRQADKWLEAFDSRDLKQMNRQYNRMVKTAEALSQHDLDTEFAGKMQHAVDSVNKLSEGKKPVIPSLTGPKP